MPLHTEEKYVQYYSTPARVAMSYSRDPKRVQAEAEVETLGKRKPRTGHIDRGCCGSWHLLSLATPSLSGQAVVLLLCFWLQ